MKKIFLLLLMYAMFPCCFSLYGQTTVTLNAVKDNTLYEDAAGSISNGTGTHIFVGLTNLSSKRRGLIQFDVASGVPVGATIVSATLNLTMDQTNSGPNAVELHAVTADWGEGTSVASGSGGNGTIAQLNDVTWLYRFYNSSLWNNPGGDFNAAPSATATISGVGSYSWTSPQLIADVQKWLDTPASNFGWCLIGNETTKQSAMRFASRENSASGSRPLLTVAYTEPLGIHESNSQSYCTVFPNPSTGKLQFMVHDVHPAELRIFNDAGLAVYSQLMVADNLTVDLSGEPAGVYVYKLLSNHQTIESGKITIKK